MSNLKVSRRGFIEGGLGLTVANFLPGSAPLALAATMEEQTIAAAKKAGAANVNGMIWSPYYVPMQPVIAEFTKETGIGIGGDRKSTRLNSSHMSISYAVFCLK